MSVGLERAPGVQAGVVWTDARTPAQPASAHELHVDEDRPRLALRVFCRRDYFGAGANVVEVLGE